jgi:hypothetical protein
MNQNLKRVNWQHLNLSGVIWSKVYLRAYEERKGGPLKVEDK